MQETLREISSVRKHPESDRLRWFQSDYFDLFVWSDLDGRIDRFQLCFDRQRNERAVSWSRNPGKIDFVEVDTDRGNALGNSSPLLIPIAPFDLSPILKRFQAESAPLELMLQRTILDALQNARINP